MGFSIEYLLSFFFPPIKRAVAPGVQLYLVHLSPRYLRLLRAALTRKISKHLYFSHGHDLTRNCQRQQEDRQKVAASGETIHPAPKFISVGDGGDGKDVGEGEGCGDEDKQSIDLVGAARKRRWRSADKKFCWNRHAGETLIAAAAAAAATDDATDNDATVTAAKDAAASVIIPLMCGSFGLAGAVHLGARVSVAVIARTSVARVGIRHHCRGSDSKGDVANFVETEQIVEIDGAEDPVKRTEVEEEEDEKQKKKAKQTKKTKKRASSFVILRGSVPLEWSQPLRDFFWKYRITIKDHAQGVAAPLRNHFADLTARYGRVTVVDLLASRGDEALLQSAFSRAVSQLQEYADNAHDDDHDDDEHLRHDDHDDDDTDRAHGLDDRAHGHRRRRSPRAVRYVAYDFHSESKSGNVAALAKLLTRLRTEVQEHGQYVEASEDAKKDEIQNANQAKTTSAAKRWQKGVFRVNCKDCLDRTNLVQSAVGAAREEILGIPPSVALYMNSTLVQLWNITRRPSTCR